MRFRATTVLFGLHATVCAVHIPKDAGSPYASMDSGVALEEPLLYDIEATPSFTGYGHESEILHDLQGRATTRRIAQPVSHTRLLPAETGIAFSTPSIGPFHTTTNGIQFATPTLSSSVMPGSSRPGAANSSGKDDKANASLVRALIIVIVVLAVLLVIAIIVAGILAYKLKKKKALVVKISGNRDLEGPEPESAGGGLPPPTEKGGYERAYQEPQYGYGGDHDETPLVRPPAYQFKSNDSPLSSDYSYSAHRIRY
ncbi:hypothetical protein C8Q76DRAFT_764022 [Earliella scabrosa]|nr:hypothetical protein C8Q76DRAFT_764022 [Earliella scabrosa]